MEAKTVTSRLNVVTLGVRDMRRQVEFYKSLGWSTAIEIEGDITTFAMRGALLTLFSLDKLAEDGKSSPAKADPGIGYTLAIMVDTADEVDEAISVVEAAGGKVTKPPHDETWGGRSAYFTDPEDNYWEVVWVPPDSAMAQAVQSATGTAN